MMSPSEEPAAAAEGGFREIYEKKQREILKATALTQESVSGRHWQVGGVVSRRMEYLKKGPVKT